MAEKRAKGMRLSLVVEEEERAGEEKRSRLTARRGIIPLERRGRTRVGERDEGLWS